MRHRTLHQEPGVIGRDLDPEGPVPTQRRPMKGWEQRARDNEQARTEVRALLHQMTAHLGGLLSIAQAAPKGDVLAQMTQIIPANGVLTRQWKEVAQAVTISNFGAGVITATTQGQQTTPPSVGSGVALVPGGVSRTVLLRGNAVTIYGLPGTPVELVAWARPRPPAAAPCAFGPCDGVLVPAGTSTSQTVAFNQETFQRLAVVQSVTAVTGSLQVTINGVTPSSYVYPILVGTAVAAPGTSVLRVGPGLTAAAGSVANDLVPRELQIVATVVAPATYGLDFTAGR